MQGAADQGMFEDDNILGFRKEIHIFTLFQDIQMGYEGLGQFDMK